MKKYYDDIKCGFATALICTIWMFLAGLTGLVGWAGFTGCTAYFASPQKGRRKIWITLACVISGCAYALFSIWAGGLFSGQTVALSLTFITTFLMCIGGSSRVLTFVPGAFMGSFSTFASGGDIMAVLSIIIGVFMGLLCDSFGKFLCRMNKEK